MANRARLSISTLFWFPRRSWTPPSILVFSVLFSSDMQIPNWIVPQRRRVTIKNITEPKAFDAILDLCLLQFQIHTSCLALSVSLRCLAIKEWKWQVKERMTPVFTRAAEGFPFYEKQKSERDKKAKKRHDVCCFAFILERSKHMKTVCILRLGLSCEIDFSSSSLDRSLASSFLPAGKNGDGYCGAKHLH